MPKRKASSQNLDNPDSISPRRRRSTRTSRAIAVSPAVTGRRTRSAGRLVKEKEEEEESLGTSSEKQREKNDEDTVNRMETDNDDEGVEDEKQAESSDDDYSDDDGGGGGSSREEEDNDGENADDTRAKKRARQSAISADRVCAHCGKSFASATGYKNHVNNKICQEGPNKKQEGKRRSTAARNQPRVRGNEEGRTCPNCKQTFTSVFGCQYHVKKGVCLKKKVSKAEIPFHTLSPGSKFITPFGIVEVVRDDRAVPVEPSTEKNDEKLETKESDNSEQGNAAGQTGSKTKGSTVQTTKDKKQHDPMKIYRNAVIRHNAQIVRARATISVLSMVRRKEFARAFETGDVGQEHVWQMQFGGDPRKLDHSQHQQTPKIKPLNQKDPSAPASSFPDRIVECRWIKDERPRFQGLVNQLLPLEAPSALPENRPNVFLSRRLLTEPYSVGTPLHMCPRCGQKFLSKPGAKYHIETSKCELPKGKEDSMEQLEILDQRANDILKRKDKRRAEERANQSRSASRFSIQSNPGPIAQKPALHEKVSTAATPVKTKDVTTPVKKDQPKDTHAQHKLALEAKALAKTLKEKKLELQPSPTFVDPRIVLAQLQSELQCIQSVMLGPIYPGVFKALKFRKPGTKGKRKRRSKEEIAEDERREKMEKERKEEAFARASFAKKYSKTLFPEASSIIPFTMTNPAMPEQSMNLASHPNDEEKEGSIQDINSEMALQLVMRNKLRVDYEEFLASLKKRPPFINTRVLIHEIDAGRYPSINRQAGRVPGKDPELNKCPICKTDSPVLHKCNFCPRSVHISCARLKWTLPDPEPYDDFLCTVCIQAITQRRNRAERRRIERVKGLEAAATTPNVTEMVHPPIPLHRQVVENQEYEACVSQGRHMANLLDLESDARSRLRREMKTTQLNNLRRQMMM